MSETAFAVAGATGRLGRHVVNVLAERGHRVVPMSRDTGVDIITGAGLAEALAGAGTIIDVASWHASDQEAATDFFRTSAANLHEAGQKAGVARIATASIIGVDNATAGFVAAKKVHEQVLLSGPLPVRILRAAQFHEFVGQYGIETPALDDGVEPAEHTVGQGHPVAYRGRLCGERRGERPAHLAIRLDGHDVMTGPSEPDRLRTLPRADVQDRLRCRRQVSVELPADHLLPDGGAHVPHAIKPFPACGSKRSVPSVVVRRGSGDSRHGARH